MIGLVMVKTSKIRLRESANDWFSDVKTSKFRLRESANV